MTREVIISLREVAEETWEEFHLEPLEHLRGEQGLLYAKEWLLWTQLKITVGGRELLPSPSSPTSLLSLVMDLPLAVETAERKGRSEWFVAHEGPYLILDLDEHHEHVAVSKRSFGQPTTFEGEAPWPIWVAAAKRCVEQAREQLISRASGPHAEIVGEWLKAWALW